MGRAEFLARARDRVVVLDGAMGTEIMRRGLGPDDFAGQDGFFEVLVRTRPDVIRDIHDSFLAVGCDAIETNTFGAFDVVLAEHGLAGQARDLGLRATRLARQVADAHASAAHPRFVVGSVGPGTKLPTLGHISFRDLRDAYLPLMEAFVAGGADAVCIETCQDLLQVKAAWDALRLAQERLGREVARLVSVTVERTGALLLGSELPAALAALLPLGPDVFGLNCATGPAEMARPLAQLAALGPARLLAMPNAGLPENEGGTLVYRLSPEDFARQVERFVREQGVGVVGGCCGTTPAHLAALVERVGGLAAPLRTGRQVHEVASLYHAVALRQEPPPLLVGERANATGSRAFRRAIEADDLEAQVSVAREQEDGGAHVLDVSVALAGRAERADMSRLVERLAREARLPLVIDSTDPDVVEAALERYGGRAIINSIHFEAGEARFDRIAGLARRFGAALVALAIDEQGMAMTHARKIEVAERILARCTAVHGLRPQDLLLDLLTFTVASGEETRGAARETLAAIRTLKQRHPALHTLLGLSNVSFGLKPGARRVLNAVFLDMALEAGLDAAIVNARQLIPLARLDATLVEAARRLLLDDHAQGDPMDAYLAHFDSGGGPRAGRGAGRRARAHAGRGAARGRGGRPA